MKKVEMWRGEYSRVLTIVLACAMLCGFCADVVADAGEKLRLRETDERMFWEIQGKSADGSPSTVYILGTIHVGDERLYPISDVVQGAFERADRVFGELSAVDMKNAEASLAEKIIAEASNIDTEQSLVLYLSEDEVTFLESVLPAEYLYEAFLYDPWFLLNLLSTVELEKTELTAEYGIDFAILSMAEEQGIVVQGLDALKTQIDILTYEDFTFDEQLEMLQKTLKDFMKESTTGATIDELYEVYLANNKGAMAKIIAETEDISSATFEKYMKIIFDDRNSAWAKLIPSFIENGGTTFIFAGVGHFVGDNSVFEYIKKNVLPSKRVKKARMQ